MTQEHSPTPWEWVPTDGSMFILGTEGIAEFEGHVLSLHVCKSCEKSGNRCMLPSEADMQFILAAVNSFDALKAACELTASIFTTEPMDAADYKDAAARIDAAIAAARAALSLAEQTK